MYHLRRELDLRCSAAHFFSILLDYANYPAFFQEVRGAQMLCSSPEEDVVAFEALFIRRFRYTLRMRKGEHRSLRWTLIDGDFTVNEGSWELQERDESTTHAVHTVRLETTFLIPRFIQQRVLDLSIPRMLRRLKQHAERTYRV